jgi:hypothetical protein
MKEKESLLRDYSVSVRYPEVSGFEVLELLDLRTRIAKLEADLTEDQMKRLEEADSLFLKNISSFYDRLCQVGDLAQMREQAGISPSHWWWYLEKLVQVEKVSL